MAAPTAACVVGATGVFQLSNANRNPSTLRQRGVFLLELWLSLGLWENTPLTQGARNHAKPRPSPKEAREFAVDFGGASLDILG